MSTCQRFEHEGIARLEQGLPLDDDHFERCADCDAARQAYRRLQHDLAALGSIAPPANWQAGVWAAIARRQSARRRPVQVFAYAATLAAAAAVVILVFLPRFQPQPTPTLRAEVQPSVGSTQRGDVLDSSPLQPGSRLVLNATAAGARYAELRVYRNEDQLVFQTAHVGRASADAGLQATLLLDAIGRYQAALLLSSQSIPAPSGTLDADVTATRNAGGRVILGPQISVR